MPIIIRGNDFTLNMVKLVNVKVTEGAREILRQAKEEGQTYSEVLESSLVTDRLNKAPSVDGGSQEGVIYLSSTGVSFETAPFNIKTLTRMLENPYIAMKLNLNTVLYFPSQLKAKATDPGGTVSEEVSKDISDMIGIDGCSLSERIKQAEYDSRCYGVSLYNPVWDNSSGVDLLTSVRHLPSWSFSRAPDGYDKTYSLLLPGITINPQTNEIEYWQIQEDGNPLQIKNIMSVKNPRDEGLAGDSKLAPLYDFINMLKFGWNVELQAIARAGSPIFFLKITKPRKATDAGTGGISDVSLGNKILSSWSTSKQHLLRENMDIVGLPVNQKIDVMSAIERMESMIDSYFSLTNEIKQEGSRIGGSDLSELKLLNRAIQGIHSWLLAPFEKLVNEYFIRNGFPDGWHCKLYYEAWEEDDREIRIKQVETGLNGDAVDLADIRAKLDFEPADEAKIKSILEFNKQRHSYTASNASNTTDDNSTGTLEDKRNVPDAQANDANRKKNDDKKTKAGDRKNKASNQGNQGYKDLDDLGTQLYNDIVGDFETMITSLSKVLSR